MRGIKHWLDDKVNTYDQYQSMFPKNASVVPFRHFYLSATETNKLMLYIHRFCLFLRFWYFILVLFRQCITLVLSRQCITLVLFRQCITLVLFRQWN